MTTTKDALPMTMTNATLLLLCLVGQTPAKDVGVSYSDGRYWAKDDNGVSWYHGQEAWLRQYVAGRNAAIRSARKPPAAPGGGAVAPDSPPGAAVANYGVASENIPTAPRSGWYGGNAPTPPVGDSAGKPPARVHLTVVGPGAGDVVKRWRAEKGFAAAEDAMGDRLAVQAYEDATNPMVSEIGLPDNGKPDVVIQSADGKVLDRWHYDPGGDVVAGQLRRRDPAYDPSRDPSGASPPDLLTLAVANPVPTGLGLALLAFLVSRKRGQ